MNDFVSKPFSPEDLYAMLQRWLKPSTPSDVLQRQSMEQASFENSDDFLPSIEGLDVTRGIKLMRGNSKRYAHILHRFIESQSGVVQQIRQALLDNKCQEAERVAHSLKGLAGQIAAESLAKKAEILERVIHMASPEADLERLLIELQLVLDAVCVAIRSALSRRIDDFQASKEFP